MKVINRIAGMFLLCFYAFNLFGQTPLIALHSSVSLKRDSTQKRAVLSALDAFLKQIPEIKTDSANTTLQQLGTLALTDEMKDSGLTWQVINLVRLNDSMYRIQLLAFKRNEINSSISLMAVKRQENYSIQSPLTWNMRGWKQYRLQQFCFYYDRSINKSKAKQFAKKFKQLNRVIGTEFRQTYFLTCDDLSEALRLIGVSYKANLTGLNSGSVSQKGKNCLLISDGNFTSRFKALDPHDFWHYCLYKWKPRTSWNRSVDEGCAYLFGGSWGLSWHQILQQFHRFADTTSNSNWLELYEKPFEFTGSNTKPLYVAYVLNALIIQRMQSDSGLDGVRALLASSSDQKGNENYFRILEASTGISRINFNSRMNDLIHKSR